MCTITVSQSNCWFLMSFANLWCHCRSVDGHLTIREGGYNSELDVTRANVIMANCNWLLNIVCRLNMVIMHIAVSNTNLGKQERTLRYCSDEHAKSNWCLCLVMVRFSIEAIHALRLLSLDAPELG